MSLSDLAPKVKINSAKKTEFRAKQPDISIIIRSENQQADPAIL